MKMNCILNNFWQFSTSYGAELLEIIPNTGWVPAIEMLCQPQL